ncbi:unnamed protein product [Dibothriocephalus latus]|uniref:Sugar phosphate transporter domain-containing protein n=1 Tax=Dibothriocephalus latus TaxID=60516 RepID=A0A3P7LVP3_DIBLA|nr:unnamed protein product [Dibothriocephalus latus]
MPIVFRVDVILLWFLWCAVGTGCVIFNKSLLLIFPHPLTSSFGQLLHTFTLSWISLRFIGEKKEFKFNRSHYILLLSLGLTNVLSIGCMHLSVHLLSAAYAHMVKSTMPVFVVLYSFVLGQKFPCKTYVALSMIITGVAITSHGEASFNGLGFAAAIGSTMAGAAYGFIMKEVMILTKLHEFQLLRLVSGLSLILLLPVWLIVDFRQIFLSTDDPLPNAAAAAAATTKILCLLLADGLSRYLQNSLGVMLLARLTPLGYSVGNVLKRLFSILSSLLFFATPITLLHVVGISTAMLGLLAYNVVSAALMFYRNASIFSLLSWLYSEYHNRQANFQVVGKKSKAPV